MIDTTNRCHKFPPLMRITGTSDRLELVHLLEAGPAPYVSIGSPVIVELSGLGGLYWLGGASVVYPDGTDRGRRFLTPLDSEAARHLEAGGAGRVKGRLVGYYWEVAEDRANE